MGTFLQRALMIAVVWMAGGLHAEISSYPYKITTTIGMVNDVVAEVAGEHANCSNIIGEGIDPHLYPLHSGIIKTGVIWAMIVWGNKKGLIGEDKPFESGAGEQIRTVVISLEG